MNARHRRRTRSCCPPPQLQRQYQSRQVFPSSFEQDGYGIGLSIEVLSYAFKEAIQVGHLNRKYHPDKHPGDTASVVAWDIRYLRL